MSKLGNSLRMLFILKSGRVVKAKEIAEQLEVTVKEVGRYKVVLEEFFDIESLPGPNGGYRLRDTYFPFKEVLKENEVRMLKDAIGALNDVSLDNSIELKNIINKINYSIINKQDDGVSEQMIPYSKVKSIGGLHKKICDVLCEAIISSYETKISYKDNSGELSDRRVQPYQFLRYKGEKYLVANCLLRNEVRFFKIARIQACIVTSKKFEKTVNVKGLIEEYKCNNIGIFEGREYNLILEISPPMANTVSERVWVENQEISELHNGIIRFKAAMKGGPEIISWILSMGSCVKIIEPQQLREEIIVKLEDMIKNNKNF
ncbi:MAG: WYL domain-containing protein [Clostridium sp.]|uniref:helix-turn-helix transcriptional regulator n=1 Tax=Clostridium sp. TaxID=1506 RepID=UPI0030613D80